MMIVGVVSAAALGAFAADLRAADQAQRMLPAVALAQDRLTALETAVVPLFDALPDSLARGQFDAPFDEYSWTASVRAVRALPGLSRLKVTVSWRTGSFSLAEQRYDPTLFMASR